MGRISFLGVLFLIGITGYAQSVDYLYIQCKSVVDGEPIMYAKVAVQHEILLTNSDGIVTVPYLEDQIVNITHLGYDSLNIPLKNLDPQKLHVFYLKPRVYELREFTVQILGPRYTFDNRFAKLNLGKSESEILAEKMGLSDMAKDLKALELGAGNGIPLGSPITSLYNRFSKAGKELRKYQELISQKRSRDALQEKFNPHVVFSLTQYQGDGLYDFMDFCSFSESYVRKVATVDLYFEILYCRDEFERPAEINPNWAE